KIAFFRNPVAGRQLQEESFVELALGAAVDVLDRSLTTCSALFFRSCYRIVSTTLRSGLEAGWISGAKRACAPPLIRGMSGFCDCDFTFSCLEKDGLALATRSTRLHRG